nr:hypothetical protein [uncultured Lichenicoccus sp.]
MTNTTTDRPEFKNKSPAYIEAYAQTEAEEATRRGSPAPTVRVDAAPVETFRTGEGSMDFHTDAADSTPPTLTAATAARRKMLIDGGMRADAADHRLGLTDHATRDRDTAAAIAKVEATHAAHRADIARKLATQPAWIAGQNVQMRLDNATPTATAAQARMQVRADLFNAGTLPPATRSDVADYQPDRTLSASEARRRLFNTGS